MSEYGMEVIGEMPFAEWVQQTEATEPPSGRVSAKTPEEIEAEAMAAIVRYEKFGRKGEHM
jgi:hypothetical protein